MTGIRRLTGPNSLKRWIVAAIAITVEVIAFVIWRSIRGARTPEADPS